MTKIEIWGPVTWTFFHTMVEKINDNASLAYIWDVFNKIRFICSALPCPECSEHATAFLSKFTAAHVNTKDKLKNIIYMFHNSVNARKRKPLYNYANIGVYSRYRLLQCFENFKLVYNTKGNMQMLNDSFRRTLVLNDINKWLYGTLHMFVFSDVIKPVGAAKASTNIVADVKKADIMEVSNEVNNLLEEIDAYDIMIVYEAVKTEKADIMEVDADAEKADIMEVDADAEKADVMEVDDETEKDADAMEVDAMEVDDETEKADVMEVDNDDAEKDDAMEVDDETEKADVMEVDDNWGMTMNDVLDTINEETMDES